MVIFVEFWVSMVAVSVLLGISLRVVRAGFMDIDRFRPYWRETAVRAGFLMFFIALLFIGGLGFSNHLNHLSVLGFPFGVMLVGQILVFMAIGLMFWFVNGQKQSDDEHGASEDL